MVYHNIAITRTTIAGLKKCKLIVRCGVGFDNVDHIFARSRGIPVGNVPDYGTEEVADSAIGMALALARALISSTAGCSGGAAPGPTCKAHPIFRLPGRVFGIIGLGRIGTAAALQPKTLGMDVAFYDPHQTGRLRQGARHPPRREA